jgi:hypothetical protein
MADSVQDQLAPPDTDTCPASSCRLLLAIVAETLPFVTCLDHRQLYLLDDLLRSPTPPASDRIREALRAWQERAKLLRRIAAQALAEGHPLVAASIHQRAGMLEDRIRQNQYTVLSTQ